MAKFKVGDKVRIRKDLIAGKQYGGMTLLIGHMSDCIGMTGLVKKCDSYLYTYAYKVGDFYWTEEMLEPAFTKADLKDGMVVETIETHNNRYLVMGDHFIQPMCNLGIGYYSDDLTRGDHSPYTIAKVYKSTAPTIERLFDDKYLELIWERPKEEPVKEMTVAEIEKELGYKIKVVAEE